MKKLTKKQAFDKKIKEYKKFLKDDEDWDWHFIIRLLRYKLERTRKCIASNKIVLSAPQIAKEIKAVEKILLRIEKNRYEHEVFKDFYKKYGRPKMASGKPDPKTSSMPIIFKYPNETPKIKKQREREFLKLARKADRMPVEDLRRAFRLMEKNIWGWWD